MDPIVANQTFRSLRDAFRRYYRETTGHDIDTGEFSQPGKRADFVLASQENTIQIVEIKRPSYEFAGDDLRRLVSYVEAMEKFFAESGNLRFRDQFPRYHATLVCDRINLEGVGRVAFEGLTRQGTLTHVTWDSFLSTTRKVHEAFLQEAERQQLYVPRA